MYAWSQYKSEVQIYSVNIINSADTKARIID
jgi:hypothetical protein